MTAAYKKERRIEIGVIRKEWGGRTSIAIVYPNTYYVGMSNLAVHLLYQKFNADPRVVAERVFLQDIYPLKSCHSCPPLSRRVNSSRNLAQFNTLDPRFRGDDRHSNHFRNSSLQKGSKSEESGRDISDFRVVSFSFSFEADYLNISKILGANISPYRKERREDAPVLIAGGPAVTLNPNALSDIFDVIVVGEIEEIADDLIEIIKNPAQKTQTLEELSKLEGIYVPGVNSENKVKRIYAKDLDRHPTHSVIWASDTEFGHMHLIEVARGCPWKCKFCATPPIYSPYRFRNKKTIMSSIEYGLQHRRHVGLIGSDVAGHPDFAEIASELTGRGIKISLSSLRVNRLTKEVALILAASGHKRATLGIEAGTERLRKLIDKDLSDAKIFSAVKNLSQTGITNLKLYYMIGLPGEREDDIKGIAELTKEIRGLIIKERKLKTMSPNISLVITPFVPKKSTPFEAAPFAGAAYLNNALKLLRPLIGKIPNTKMTGESPRGAELEDQLSNGKLPFFS